MLKRIITEAQDFYRIPENRQAFEAWKMNKEDQFYAANHINS